MINAVRTRAAAPADTPSAPGRRQRRVVFKLTFPNGKIFVGSDLQDRVTYFGNVDPELVARDMTPRQRNDVVLRREVIWESDTATAEEVATVEAAYIRALGADDPAMGYNPPAQPRA